MEYGMFSDNGNKHVHKIVQHYRKLARKGEYSFDDIAMYAKMDLIELAIIFEEADDTEVRENVLTTIKKAMI
ncbi:MAG: hypothetical protein N0C84_00755 [Candidatus Thiodiazotropha taylori]|uniref:Uncharacterized protein n=1 Tax=Candidatus Thiodiazotropha taylori TaxID=2792791 RepID=A0A9E4KA20_9GAMM|nr:hypothetical protein [Candidatus Thiodiazotropha taylori]MCW4254975.1 hypothetical protein [Candidatus Thiodiazotropha taylori]